MPGRLFVRADQDDAEVLIDGRNVGMTPLELELKPGSYKVRVRREGYLDWNGQVDLRAGDESTLSALLPRKKTPVAARPATPSPEPEVKPEPEPEAGTGTGTGSASETGTASDPVQPRREPDRGGQGCPVRRA